MPQLLFDDQDNIDLQDWDTYLEETICRCAEAALNKKYTHFALQNLGQCFSGPDVEETYNRDGISENCVSKGGLPSAGTFEKCVQPNLYCAGGEKANFVYGLKNGKNFQD